ncbi:NUDIX domain-containing protein [Prosthecobacter sp.]|uniref:NUDIX hydrolase n=1 Tax=Prosthecobacter sp. TaxID=1965333 RepID=UPI00248883B5|nr:NUDIX domain-containing protein [Prosthecobacter sp.]MDI1313469.1 NUDIX domain-containing protein [Prosthecobacter sp.]
MVESPFKFCSDCGKDDWIPKSDREFVCAACGFRHFITPIPAAVALLLDSQDRVLIIRRAHEPGFGKLGLPGGVIEPEESGEVAAARETHEEVGIDLPASAFTYLCTLNNRYLFQGYTWPTIDLCYIARVPDFSQVVMQAAEVSEILVCALDEVPLEEFAFESNAEAVRRWRARGAVA